MDSEFKRNIPLLYLYSVLIKRVSMPIIIIYFLLNNLNFTQIGILAAVMSIVSIATEVHGGIFADLHGKKKSLILHSVFGVLTMFFYFIGDSFYYFLTASVAYGLAMALVSGTRNALLYDTLSQLGKSSDFKKYNGRMISFSHFFNALILLLIPVAYTFNPKLPFLIGIGFFMASLITARFFIEPPLTAKSKKTLSAYNLKFFEAIKEIFWSKKALSAIILTMITSAFVFMSSEFIQPLLQISGLKVIYFGIIYALMRVILGLAGEITPRLERFFNIPTLLCFGFGFILISLFGFSFGNGFIIILAILLIKFAEGFNRIILEDEINKNIKAENRTTILSISSLSRHLLKAFLVFSFGIVADIVGVQGMFVYVIITLVIITAIAIMFIKKNSYFLSQKAH